jgi:hypothetical protein
LPDASAEGSFKLEALQRRGIRHQNNEKDNKMFFGDLPGVWGERVGAIDESPRN